MKYFLEYLAASVLTVGTFVASCAGWIWIFTNIFTGPGEIVTIAPLFVVVVLLTWFIFLGSAIYLFCNITKK